MPRVGVLGVGKTKNGFHRDKSLRDLMMEASQKAIEDAGISPKNIQMVVVGNSSSQMFNSENNLGAMLSDHIGATPAPSACIESACATGSWAMYVGYMGILAGLYDAVLACGVEKMTDVSTEKGTFAIAQSADVSTEYFTGLTFPSGVALYQARYIDRWGASEEDLCHVSVKNHYYGARNPYAQLRFECTVEDVMKSPYVAYPIKLYEICPMTDSASTVILCREEMMRESGKEPIYITGSGATSGTYYNSTDQLEDNYVLVERAAKPCFEMAGLSPEDIDVLECYNAFAIQEPLGLEGAGFFPLGESWKAVRDGLTHHDGKIPTNISGGVLTKGHPLGGTGTSQAVDIVEQMRGNFTGVQVEPIPEIGMMINRGGPGSVCICYTYQKE